MCENPGVNPDFITTGTLVGVGAGVWNCKHDRMGIRIVVKKGLWVLIVVYNLI